MRKMCVCVTKPYLVKRTYNMHESLPSNKIYRRGGAFSSKLLEDLVDNHGCTHTSFPQPR
jgi:hypothetical protein